MNHFQKLLAPIHRRVMNMLARGVIKVIKDNGGLQIVQASGRADEVFNDVERLQGYGMTARPPVGSECLLLFINGNTDHPVCVAAEDRATRKAAIQNIEEATGEALAPGDVLIYSTDENFILLRAAGNVIINSPETIRLQAKKIEFHATEKIKWDVLGAGFDYYVTHTDSWEQGRIPGSTNPVTPPEHPPDPAS